MPSDQVDMASADRLRADHSEGNPMKRLRPKRALTVLALSAAIAITAALVVLPSAGAIQVPQKYLIVPGQAMGPVDLGMKRKTVENLPLLHGKPSRSQNSGFYALTYHYPDAQSGLFIVTFHGLSKRAKAVSVTTTDQQLVTDRNLGVGDSHLHLLAKYGSVDCYHKIPGGGRDHHIDPNENQECELHSNGGYTYFGFASEDADPAQSIGVIMIASGRVT
jgi:hypothetical protein